MEKRGRGGSGNAMPDRIALAAELVRQLQPVIAEIAESDEESLKAFRAAVGDDVFYATLDGMKAMASRDAHRFFHGLPYDGPEPNL